MKQLLIICAALLTFNAFAASPVATAILHNNSGTNLTASQFFRYNSTTMSSSGSSLANGATRTFTGTPAGGSTLWFKIGSPTGVDAYNDVGTQSGYAWGGVDATYHFYLIGTPPCNYFGRWTVQNGGSTPQVYALYKNGEALSLEANQSVLWVSPGQTATASFDTGTNHYSITNAYTVRQMGDGVGMYAVPGVGVFFHSGSDGNGGLLSAVGTVISVPIAFATCSAPSSSTTGRASDYTQTGGGPNTPPDITSTNSLVMWNTNAASSANLTEKTAKEGFDAMLKAMKENTVSTDTGIAKMDFSIASGLSNVLGAINGQGTNETGIVGAINRFHTDNTNLLGQILGKMGTNNGVDLGASIPGFATNGTSATTAASAAIGMADGVVGDTIDTLQSMSYSGPSGGDFTMEFAGQTIDLDPVQLVGPAVGTFCINIFTFVLGVCFVISAGNLFMDCVKIYASQSTGGVPDLNASAMGLTFGAGGNLLGLLVAIAVPAVFIGLWITALYLVFTVITTGLTNAMGFNTAASSMGLGYYILCSFFPVSVFLNLLFTRLALQFTMGKVVILASSASRFLFGK